MKLFLGIPSARYNYIEPIARILHWVQETKHELLIEIDTVNGIYAARSRLITHAKKWGADVVLLLDSDVVPQVVVGKVLAVLGEDFSRGYGCIISPTLSSSGQIMLRRPEGQPDFKGPWEVPGAALFEIRYGAGGFIAIKGEVLEKLKVLTTQPFVNGPPEPIYCTLTPEMSEDHSLMVNIHDSTGFKIGADSRILTVHVKPHDLPSWRGMQDPQYRT